MLKQSLNLKQHRVISLSMISLETLQITQPEKSLTFKKQENTKEGFRREGMDVNQDETEAIWDILSHRYISSGMDRLFK